MRKHIHDKPRLWISYAAIETKAREE